MLTYYCFALDFGYEWQWTHGHLVPLALFGALLAFSIHRSWRRWIQVTLGLLAAWSLAGFLIIRYALAMDAPVPPPTERFLAQATGSVVDLGAGSGRATLGLALARPRLKVVALDRFAEGYGIGGNTPNRLRANLAAAGVAGRVEIREGDMRQLPFGDNTFDGALSAYAMDHLRRDDFRKALAETARVLKPGGEFLFFTINRDLPIKIAFPLLHGGYFGPSPAPARWRAALTSSGAFDVAEEGTTPGTLYFVCRKVSAP